MNQTTPNDHGLLAIQVYYFSYVISISFYILLTDFSCSYTPIPGALPSTTSSAATSTNLISLDLNPTSKTPDSASLSNEHHTNSKTLAIGAAVGGAIALILLFLLLLFCLHRRKKTQQTTAAPVAYEDFDDNAFKSPGRYRTGAEPITSLVESSFVLNGPPTTASRAYDPILEPWLQPDPSYRNSATTNQSAAAGLGAFMPHAGPQGSVSEARNSTPYTPSVVAGFPSIAGSSHSGGSQRPLSSQLSDSDVYRIASTMAQIMKEDQTAGQSSDSTSRANGSDRVTSPPPPTYLETKR